MGKERERRIVEELRGKAKSACVTVNVSKAVRGQGQG